MSKGHTIEVEFDERGIPTFHVRGMRGKGCAKILAELERAIGKRVGEVKHTEEYWRAEESAKEHAR